MAYKILRENFALPRINDVRRKVNLGILICVDGVMKKNNQDWNDAEKVFFPEWKARLTKSPVLQDLPIEAQKDWNSISFRTIDSFLKKHCREITCADVSALYWKFWWDLKKIKSNSTNFVGYSELLIMRLLLHFLKSEHQLDFEDYSRPNPDSPGKDLGYFKSSNGKYVVATECVPKEFRSDLGKRRPDIVLYRRDLPELMAIIQVKSFPASASNVKTDLTFLDEVESNPKFKSTKNLVIIFYGCEGLSDRRICKLWENEMPLLQVLSKSLNLTRLKA